MLVEACALALLLLLYAVARDAKPWRMPPGPREIPFFGNRSFRDLKYMLRLRELYGDVVTTRLTDVRTVLVYDYALARQTMASADFADRPAFYMDLVMDDRKQGGVVSANGAHWRHDRRFILRVLGGGRSSLEDSILTEARAMVEDLRSYGGAVVHGFPLSLRMISLNIIWQMVAGKRYDLRSKEVTAIFEATNELRSQSTLLSQLFFLAPKWLKYIVPKIIQVKVFKTHLIENFLNKKKAIVNKHVDEGDEKLKKGMYGNDLISEYLLEMKKCETEVDPPFWRGALIQNISDLFGAGSDTVYNMLKWTVFLMARYPDLVDEMRLQIDSVTPRGQLVSLERKDDMPLVEAFITEALRYSSLVVFNIHRAAARDSEINGYYIPKGTVVQVVNICIHHDPKFWANPHEFNPKRFLTADGKYCAPKEGFFAFGSGRRQCLGESLAKSQYFIFSATLIQNFDIKVPQGSELVTDFEDGVELRVPKDQPLVFEYRS